MAGRRMRTPRALALAVAALLLAGCVGLPDSGAVHEGEVQQESNADGGLEYIAEPPAEGASQEAIVLGFLQAATGTADDFDIARQYLSGAFASSWDPTASVTVRTGAPVVSEVGEDMLDVTTDVVGTLDAHGRYTTVDDATTSLTFSLEQDAAGEWRIVDGPDGIVLTAFYFERLFETTSLSWLTPDLTRSVPEVRWFEESGAAAAEHIVDAIMAGPADWLAPAVWTAGDADARRIGGVDITSRTATVTLSDEQVRESDSSELALLAQQMLTALVGAGIDVDEVVVEIDIPGGYSASSTDAPPLVASALDSRPIVLVGDTLEALGSGPETDLPFGPGLDEADATDATALDDGSVAVALGGDEVVRLTPDGEPQVLARDVDVPPSLDRLGWAWWVDETGELHASDGESTVTVGTAYTSRVLSIAVSRDGSRIAVLTEGASVSHMLVAGIVRDADGVPTTVTSGLVMPDIAGTGIDLTWTGAATLAVLSDGEEGSTIVHVEVGGESTQLATPSSTLLSQLVGGDDGVSALRARGVDGTLLALRGGVWQTVDTEPIDLIVTRI